MTKPLHRYWFQFQVNEAEVQTWLSLGCGVTAYDRDDALALLKEPVFRSAEIPKIERMTEDIDVTQLDPNHVLPNMGLVTDRGIWFPRS